MLWSVTTDNGFIVQNSWGGTWGYLGFARLTYADWLANGVDAWVAVMGVPVKGASSNLLLSSTRLVGRLAPNLARGLANGATAAAAAQPRSRRNGRFRSASSMPSSSVTAACPSASPSAMRPSRRLSKTFTCTAD